MAAWKMPTYGEAEVLEKLTPPDIKKSKVSATWKLPTYGDEPKAPEKYDPSLGGSTLKVLNPIGENFDTGIELGEGTTQLLAGAGKRFNDLGLRAQQVTGVKGAQDKIDEAFKLDQPLMEKTPAMIGYALPDVAASVGAPAALSTNAARALNTMRGATIAGGVQGLTVPTTSNEKYGTAINTGLGMIGGATGQAVGQSASRFGAKVLHSMPDVIPDKLRALAARNNVVLPKAKWTNPEERRLFELAQSKQVPTTIGDIDPTSEWASVEDANKVFWTGRSSDMQKQQDATRRVLTDTLDSISSGDPGTDSVRIVKGVKDKLAEVKQVASDKFKAVSDIAGRSPNLSPIKPTNTHLMAQSAVSDYPQLFDEFKSNAQLRKLLGLAEDTGQQPGRILDPKTMNPFKYDQELNFSDAQWLRKRLGAWYDKLSSQHANGTLPAGLDGEAVKHAAQIFSAFNRDLDEWGRQPGNTALNNAWKEARDYFKDNVIPFRDPQALKSKSPIIKQIVNDNMDTATVIDKALPRRETSISTDIMEHTTPEGKRAMQSALAHKIIDPSISPDIQGLNNASLIHKVADQEHAASSVFSPRQQQAIDDAADIAKLTRRSSEAGTTTPRTGARLLPFMAGSTIAGAAPAAYFGLGMLGDSIDPQTRAALALTAAPLGVLSLMKGANNYARSSLGKNLHFADPRMGGGLGKLQEIIESGIRGAGEPVVNEYLHYPLGHRE